MTPKLLPLLLLLTTPLAAAEHFLPSPGPDTPADTLLQQAIDSLAENGGGLLTLGPGDFKLPRKPGDQTVILKSNITLRGQGFATHIYLDPKTPPNPARYFPLRIGSATVPASNVVIEHLRYTGNDKAIGGGSIMGLNARLDTAESLLLSCDNVTIRHCWIYDAKQAAGCSKQAITHVAGKDAEVYSSPPRLAAQFKNWQVYNNFIDTCGNKAVELAECNGGLIADNYMTNVTDGPQVIHGSRNVQIRDNLVYFTRTGINITEGSNHIRVTGNHVEPAESIKTNAANACLLFRTEPLPLATTISHVVVTGNIFRDPTTQQKGTLKFVTRKESLSCVYQAITITGNIFDGDVHFLDPTSPAKTTLQDILFADNICEGDLVSARRDTMLSRRVTIRGNHLRKTGNYDLPATNWIWSNNTHTNGSLTIPAGGNNNIVHDNVTTTEITDHGAHTDLANNVVRPNDP